MGRRQSVEPTDEWPQLRPLLKFPEQLEYEKIRLPVVFGYPVPKRARETGTPERTMYEKVRQFEEEGMPALFSAETAKRRVLPPAIRNMIVGLKGEHPALNNNEITNIVFVRTGRKLGKHTVERVLAEEPIPLKLVKLYEPYHQIEGGRERREAVVALRLDGWSVKAISSYLEVSRMTVYRALDRWFSEGEAGLEDKPRGRPPGVRKVDLATIELVRRLQENPELGEFRIHAELVRRGIEIGQRTVGKILSLNRRVHGMGKPKRSPYQKKEMPFAASRPHQYWSADVRYVKKHRLGGRIYVISILDNYSRALLASSITRSQDLTAFLSVLYSAVTRYGPPEALVTDSGSIFISNRAKRIYRALGITKYEIEKGKPWQSYLETAFNILRRMADWHFSQAASWEDMVTAHDRFLLDYNEQRHYAHQFREDGLKSPREVLGWAVKVRPQEEELRRAFFSVRFKRILDALGYARIMRWRLYGEEGLARCEVVLWLGTDGLTVEYGGEALARYDAEYSESGRLRQVSTPRLFETRYRLPQPRLFGLDDVLGESGWVKAIRLEEYAPRKARSPGPMQQPLFAHKEASLEAASGERSPETHERRDGP